MDNQTHWLKLDENILEHFQKQDKWVTVHVVGDKVVSGKRRGLGEGG